MRELMKKFGWDEPYIPMNVNNAESKLEKLFMDDDYVAELKRDGSRYSSIGGRFFSRKKSENKKSPDTLGLPVEKTDNVPHLKAFFGMFPDMIVEGEIFYPGKKSNNVTSIMGCDIWRAQFRQGFGEFDYSEQAGMGMWRNSDRAAWIKIPKADWGFESLGKIHYMLFEMTYVNGKDMRGLPWHVRRAELEHFYEEHVEGTSFAEHIHLSTPWEGENAKRMLLKWAEDNNEEGIVFKHRTSTYQCDKRPEGHWYRVKGKIYADVVIMGFTSPVAEYTGTELATWKYWELGDGQFVECADATHAYATAGDANTAIRPVTKNHWNGWIGSIKFGLWKLNSGKNSLAYDCRELVEAGTCSGMDDSIRQLCSEEQAGSDMIGRVIEISAMERTAKGLFRHPQHERFRDDKNEADCLWEVEGVETDG